MANIVPQAPNVNRRTWIKAEKLERKLATTFNAINVINGVVYANTPKRIGKNQIAIPKAFFKILFNHKENYQKCFYYKNDLNTITNGDKLNNHL